ncbi:hypothetical protein [Bradyrhizobium lablabi]|uniref:hypothetical protein n=1 Tax=Bradyrhizobium lablabi TaxID=722472 RepID=UPI001BAA1DDB|nr:hypothetical protein [Bradyrhizobium lablabi]
MLTYETTDRKEARRFRIAQFNGRTTTVRSGGATITGRVRSIVESKTSPAAWVITIIPEEPKPVASRLRPAPRMRAFADDYL